MTEQGRVIKASKESATVRINRAAACEGCGLCGMGINDRFADIEANNTVGAGKGDVVEISFKEGLSSRISAIVYMIPLAASLLAMWGGYALKLGDWLLTLIFSLGLAGGFLLVRLIDKKYAKKKDYVPIIKRIITQEVNNNE